MLDFRFPSSLTKILFLREKGLQIQEQRLKSNLQPRGNINGGELNEFFGCRYRIGTTSGSSY